MSADPRTPFRAIPSGDDELEGPPAAAPQSRLYRASMVFLALGIVVGSMAGCVAVATVATHWPWAYVIETVATGLALAVVGGGLAILDGAWSRGRS